MKVAEASVNAERRKLNDPLHRVHFIGFESEYEVMQAASRINVTLAAAVLFGMHFGKDGNYSYTLRPNATWLVLISKPICHGILSNANARCLFSGGLQALFIEVPRSTSQIL